MKTEIKPTYVAKYSYKKDGKILHSEKKVTAVNKRQVKRQLKRQVEKRDADFVSLNSAQVCEA